MYIRANETTKAIREAFLQCLNEKPVNEISISEICRRADLNRTTFYKHYKSTGDILNELEQDQLERFRVLFETEDPFGEDLIAGVLALVDENRQIRKAARQRILSDGFISEMAAIAKRYAYDSWKERMPKATEQEVDLALTVIIYAAIRVVADESDKCDRPTIVRLIGNLVTGCIQMYE